MHRTLPGKMSVAFIFAAAFAFAQSSTSAQPPLTQVGTEASSPSSRPWATTRKFSLEQYARFGDTCIAKWDDTVSPIATLGLAGDHTVLDQIVPTLAIDYYERLDLRAIEDRPVSQGKIVVVLRKGSVKRELTLTDLDESELSDETLLSREAVAKWRKGEPTVETIEAWLDKFADLRKSLPRIRELTAKELSETLTTDKPYEFIFYRTEASLNQDAGLTPDGRKTALNNQSAALAEIARRAARLRPLLTVRKTSTTTQLNGSCLYDLVAAGSWEGYPVGVIVRGSPKDRSEREHWGPFCQAPHEGRTYAEELEIKALLCLWLDPLLRDNKATGTMALSSGTTIPPTDGNEKKVASSK